MKGRPTRNDPWRALEERASKTKAGETAEDAHGGGWSGVTDRLGVGGIINLLGREVPALEEATFRLLLAVEKDLVRAVGVQDERVPAKQTQRQQIKARRRN